MSATATLATLPTALALAVRQLGDGAVLRVLAASIVLTLAILVFAGGLLFWLAHRWLMAGAAEDFVGVTAVMLVIAVVAAGWFLFRAVAIAVISLFADAIVDAVEARHYPAAHAAAVPPSWGRGAMLGLASLRRAVGYNLLALPLYALLAITGIGLIAALWAVNAVLLGRDLESMVASRHQAIAPLSRGQRWALGGAAAGLMLVPVVNILAPVLTAAMAVHVFHRRLPAGKDMP